MASDDRRRLGNAPASTIVDAADQANDYPLTPDGFPLMYDGLVPEGRKACDAILRAFREAGITFDPMSPSDQQCRQVIGQLSIWSYAPPAWLQFDDPDSRSLAKEISEATDKLFQLINLAAEEAGFFSDELLEESGRYRPSDLVFESIDHYEYLRDALLGLHWTTSQALHEGAKSDKRGPKPPILLHEFLKRLHSVWRAKVPSQGWYRHEGVAHGPFVVLARECHLTLSQSFQIESERSFARHVLEALGDNSSENN